MRLKGVNPLGWTHKEWDGLEEREICQSVGWNMRGKEIED
jgi:hypothetical protein